MCDEYSRVLHNRLRIVTFVAFWADQIDSIYLETTVGASIRSVLSLWRCHSVIIKFVRKGEIFTCQQVIPECQNFYILHQLTFLAFRSGAAVS